MTNGNSELLLVSGINTQNILRTLLGSLSPSTPSPISPFVFSNLSRLLNPADPNLSHQNFVYCSLDASITEQLGDYFMDGSLCQMQIAHMALDASQVSHAPLLTSLLTHYGFSTVYDWTLHLKSLQ